MTILYDFFRSSPCYRVRIALNLKGVEYERKVINFRRNDQESPDYLDVNAQGLVPTLEIDGRRLNQSLAIIDYLDTTRLRPRLIPDQAAERALVLSLSLSIHCDMHPVNNLRVLDRLRQAHGASSDQVDEWYRHWVGLGLNALEKQVANLPTRRFLFDEPTLFEICLVPQLYNARRYNVDLSTVSALLRIEEAALSLPAFSAAAPEHFAPAA
jgi:maleylacetoacetate isomerase